MTEISIVPVVEESIYDRATRSLTTYTRNVSHNELFALHERCVYKNTPTVIIFCSLHKTTLRDPTFKCADKIGMRVVFFLLFPPCYEEILEAVNFRVK